MSIQEYLQLWNHSAIFVLDIRRTMMRPGETLASFRLPASAWLLIHRGSAHVCVDKRRHAVTGAYACHAGKGALLDIAQVRDMLEYDLIFYKAVPALPQRKELRRLYRDSNPFLEAYGFAPARPLVLYSKTAQMHRLWHAHTPLEKLHVRALFHQLVFELLRQYREHEERRKLSRPDLVGQAVLYLEEHYAEELGLQELASVLQAGTRQLQRQFKARLRIGPMEYLIRIRMERAQAMLAGTNATLREIAEATGYSDSYYFSRAFKKHCGIPPIQYRRTCRTSASSVSQNSIGSENVLAYSDIDSANHYQYTSGGEFQVLKRTRTVLAVSIVLSLALLLGACSGGNGARTNASEGAAASPSPISSVAPSPTQAAQTSFPVTIAHLKGDYTLEQKPERIAVLDTKFVDQLIALQEQPAGSVTAAGSDEDFPEYLADRLTDVKVLGTRDEPNLEAIVAMDPDLIILTGFQEKVYDSVSRIAPTIMLDFDEDWRDTLVTIGKIVGKEREAAEVLEAYKAKISGLKEQFAAKLNGESVALLRPRDGGIRVHTPDHRTGAILYDDLGLVAPEAVTQVDDTAYQISLEALGDVGADHYFLLTDDMFGDEVEEYQKTETWKSLEPVKQNRVYTVDTTLWIAYYGPIAINMIVDQVGEALLGDN